MYIHMYVYVILYVCDRTVCDKILTTEWNMNDDDDARKKNVWINDQMIEFSICVSFYGKYKVLK